MLRNALVTALLVAATTAAGCLAPPAEDAETASALPPPDAAGTMTMTSADESMSTETCEQIALPLIQEGTYCAMRHVQHAGELTLSTLPVNVLAAFGDLEVKTAPAGTWSVDLYVGARGNSASAAEAETQKVVLAPSIGTAPLHELLVTLDTTDDDVNAQVQIILALPAATLYDLAVESGSGDVALGGIRTVNTVVETGSGDVGVRKNYLARTLSIETGSGDVATEPIDVGSVVLATGSGDVNAALRPTQSGAIAISTGSGDISLRLPEDSSRGYDLTATTGSGDIEFALEDGRTTQSSENQARFVSDNFSSATSRVTGSFTTGSGDVGVAPLS